jgi:hypothetical protein
MFAKYYTKKTKMQGFQTIIFTNFSAAPKADKEDTANVHTPITAGCKG